MYFYQNYSTTIFNDKLLLDLSKRLDFGQFHWKKNPDLYYDYWLQDSDTPDNLADRYYDDSTLYWIILIPNGIVDAQYEWPLDELSFHQHLTKKYEEQGKELGISGLTYAMTMPDPIYGYQKLVTVKSLTRGILTQDYYVTDKVTYDKIKEHSYYFFEQSEKLQFSVNKNNIVTIYEAERSKNENKKKIKILKEEYKMTLVRRMNDLIIGNQ